MTLYLLVVALHVMGVVLAAGSVLAVALVPEALSPAAVQRLATLASAGLAALFLTGAVAIGMTGGELGRAWWLRVSFLLFLVVGALTGRLRRAARAGRSPGALRRLSWSITGDDGPGGLPDGGRSPSEACRCESLAGAAST